MNEPRHPAAGYVGHEHAPEDALCLENVSYRYPDGTLALEEVTLHVARGSTLVIVGPNGAGKTTLLKLVLGVLEPNRGRVRVLGLGPTEARQRGDILGWVPQRPQVRWDFPITVRGVVQLGLVGKTGLLRRPGPEARREAERAMAVLGVDSLAERPIGELSGGQQQRVIIARALAPQPRLLLFDEPLVGLDFRGRETFQRLLDDVKQEYDVTIIIVSHDLQTMAHHVQRVACLDRTLHFHEAPENLTDALVNKMFGCSVQALLGEHKGGRTSPAPMPRRGEKR